MFALVAELSPLRQVVRALVEDIHLTISSVGAHDVLFNRFANSDCFDEFLDIGERISPFIRGYDFDDARLHAVRVDCCHLFVGKVSM